MPEYGTSPIDSANPWYETTAPKTPEAITLVPGRARFAIPATAMGTRSGRPPLTISFHGRSERPTIVPTRLLRFCAVPPPRSWTSQPLSDARAAGFAHAAELSATDATSAPPMPVARAPAHGNCADAGAMEPRKRIAEPGRRDRNR